MHPCQGAETCHCYPNRTCEGTLSCLSNLCVDTSGVSSVAGAGADSGASTVAEGGESGSVISAGAGGASFGEPASGALVWLRSDEGVSQTGRAVSAWRDQSGNGFDAIMADRQREPALVSNVWNGLPMIRFDELERDLNSGMARDINPIKVDSFC